MRALVTGGAGFIGSALVDRLVRQGDDVTVVDDLSRGRLSNLSDIIGRIRFVQADIRGSDLVEIMIEAGPEVIYHFAAQVDVRASVADPINDATVNVLGTINLAQAAHAAGARKIVFTSSGGSIYGTPAMLPVSELSLIHI